MSPIDVHWPFDGLYIHRSLSSPSSFLSESRPPHRRAENSRFRLSNYSRAGAAVCYVCGCSHAEGAIDSSLSAEKHPDTMGKSSSFHRSIVHSSVDAYSNLDKSLRVASVRTESTPEPPKYEYPLIFVDRHARATARARDVSRKTVRRRFRKLWSGPFGHYPQATSTRYCAWSGSRNTMDKIEKKKCKRGSDVSLMIISGDE